MNWILPAFERIIFNSRLLLAPFLLGMVVGLAALIYIFIIKLAALLIYLPVATWTKCLSGSENSWICRS